MLVSLCREPRERRRMREGCAAGRAEKEREAVRLMCWILGHRRKLCTRTVIDVTHTRFEVKCGRCNALLWIRTFDFMDNREEM